MNHRRHNQGGFIALTTAIILSLVMLLVAVSWGSMGLMTRFNLVDFHSKELSRLAARSCLNQGLLKLSLDSAYAGNETFVVSDYSCTLQSVEDSGPNKVLKARAQISGATTNLRLTVNAATLSTVSLEELQSF